MLMDFDGALRLDIEFPDIESYSPPKTCDKVVISILKVVPLSF